MCGIVGYTGSSDAARIVYCGLEQLEYRGYDSVGITTLSNGILFTRKKRGRVKVLEEYIEDMRGKTGIGHTRWATHGKVSDVNAHPHVYGKFSVVHNGIIENYAELKELYFSGEEFISQTDSEIIVRLLDKFYDGDLLYALKRVESLLSGSYAIAVICADFDGIAVVKHKSPVIIGYGADGNFIASDAPALSGTCAEITVLEDGDFALIEGDSVSVFNGDMQAVIRERIENIAKPSGLELGESPHFMLKEILENPETIEKTRAAYLRSESEIKKIVVGAKRVIILGCGTAYNSGLVAKRYIESFAHIPAEAEIAGEFRYKNPIITPETVTVAISQSGETADTIEAAELAQKLGSKVIAVTNSPYSRLTRCANAVINVEAGCEICVAATKSYIGQIAALYLLAKTIGGVSAVKASKKLAVLSKLVEKTIRGVNLDCVADMCARSSGVYFLGRDIDYAVAQEGSLKLKEISYVPSEGYPAGELKHGTLALIDIGTASLIIITDGSLAPKSENAVEQVLSRRGKAVIISNVGGVGKRFKGKAEFVKIPKCDKYLSPLLSATVLQLLAYKTALLLERDPDKPRNLAKSVTVE